MISNDDRMELLRTGEKVAEITTESFSFKPVILKDEVQGRDQLNSIEKGRHGDSYCVEVMIMKI